MSPSGPVRPPAYRPGDYVGTSRGQVVFDRMRGSDHAVVRSRSSVYTLPPQLQNREAVRQWVERQVRAGGIGTRLYPKPGEHDARRVASVHAAIRETLQGATVRRSDLAGLTPALIRLSGSERQALVDGLAGTRSGRVSMLEHWMSEVLSPGWGEWGALDRPQRQALFSALVDGQDPRNLERIALAAGSRRTGLFGNGMRDPRPMVEFARAVAVHGTFEQRLGLLKRLSDDAVRGLPGSGRAMAELFAAARTRHEVDATFAELDRPTTDAMVAAGLVLDAAITTSVLGGNTTVIRGDTSLFRRMAAAASLATSATEKASFVAASGPVLEASHQMNFEGIVRRRDLLNALSGVIGTDVGGVIDSTLMQTARGGSSSGRKALQAYASGLLDTGLSAHAEAIVLSLQRGPDARSDPMTWLAATSARNGEAPTYHRARLLGEFLGLFAGVVESRLRERDMAAALGYAAFAGTADSVKELTTGAFPGVKVVTGVGVAGLKGIVATALLEWRATLRDDERDFARTLHEAALPRHPSGAEATAPWVTTFNAHYFGSLRR